MNKLFIIPVLSLFLLSACSEDKNSSETVNATENSITASLSDTSSSSITDIVQNGQPWINDMTVALERAKTEDKDLLINFTGSDWCSWCIKIRDEIFSHNEFIDEAPKDFILVEIDFPQSIKQSENLKAQNSQLQMKYAIQGYPTIILTDSVGNPYGQAGYQPGGPVVYMNHLLELKGKNRKAEQLLIDAENSSGREKLVKLNDYYLLKEADGNTEITDRIMNTIIEEDKDNQYGFKKAYEIRKDTNNILRELTTEDEAPKAMEDLEVLFYKAESYPQVQISIAMSLAGLVYNVQKDPEMTIKWLQAAYDADPIGTRAGEIKQIIASLKSNQA
ncbi:MAG: thioredoxin family protein [Spirochaetaceae bacterium]|nr:thioredoxin family protein [Spirochaetaceae bacterium]